MTTFRPAFAIAATMMISSPVYAEDDAKCSMLTAANDPTGGAMRYVIGRFRQTMERLDMQHPEMKPFDEPDYAIARSIKTLCHDGPDQTIADRDQTI